MSRVHRAHHTNIFQHDEAPPANDRAARFRKETMAVVGRAVHRPNTFAPIDPNVTYGVTAKPMHHDIRENLKDYEVPEMKEKSLNKIKDQRKVAKLCCPDPNEAQDVVYGAPTHREEPNVMRELISPNGPEPQETCENYVKSHHHYRVGEQRRRGYDLHGQDIFGTKTQRDAPMTVRDLLPGPKPMESPRTHLASTIAVADRTRRTFHIDPSKLPAAGAPTVRTTLGDAAMTNTAATNTMQSLITGAFTPRGVPTSHRSPSSGGAATPRPATSAGTRNRQGLPDAAAVLSERGSRAFDMRSKQCTRDVMWSIVQALPPSMRMNEADFDMCWERATENGTRAITPQQLLETAHFLGV
eukprot:PhM_4_TR15871/c0_g1_i1/m.84835